MNIPTRICPICKTSVTPGERFCGNCGTPYPEPTAIDPTQRSAPPPPQAGQTPYNEVPPPYGATSYGANMPPLPNNVYNPTVPAYDPGSTPAYGPSVPPYDPTNLAQNYNPSTPNYSSSSPTYNSPPPYTPGPPVYPYQPGPQIPPKRSKTGLIVGIIIAVTVVVLAACGGSIFLIAKIGSTAKVQGTPAATATVKPQMLFSDNFANNNNNWSVGSSSGLSVTIDNSILTMKESNQKRLDEEIPTNQSYNDFTLTAKVTLISGDSNDRAGFRFRASGDDLGYYIRIFGDNTYDIHKVSMDNSNQAKDIELVNVTSSSALHTQGQENLVQVIAKGSTIALYFNGTKVQSVTDTAFTSGPIYLNAGNGDTSSGVVVSFKSVEIDAAPATIS